MNSQVTAARQTAEMPHGAALQPPKQLPMTPWYSLRQLASTAVQVVISTIFAQRSDARLLEALAFNSGPAFRDHTRPYKWIDGHYVPDPGAQPYAEIWVDFAADTGDGFNSTYAVAYCAAQDHLALGNYNQELPRGDILVFGGDEVYPVASQHTYQDRTVGPWQAALPQTERQHAHLYAIPGNHDWYDSLVGFTRLFCSGRWFGGWRTEQDRSYFALRLPHHWWLIGTDIQLDSDVDAPQVEYLRAVAAKMEKGDKIILCNAEPHWIYEKLYRQYDERFNQSNLKFVERIFSDKATIKVNLSGDLHHYRRHQDQAGKQKIVAGGGGAFLHPTHGPNVDELPEGFSLKACFPPKKKSASLTFGNLLFPFKNPGLGLITAFLYLMTCWVTMVQIGDKGLSDALAACGKAFVAKPAPITWLLTTFFGIWMFTDTFSKAYRWIAGTVHGLSHLFALFLIAWQAQHLAKCWSRPGGSVWLLSSGALIALAGYFVGPVILSLYLIISLNVFSHHVTEAFSSLAIPDWKNFLRMKIDQNGLTIYPIGIRKVPRKWRWVGDRGTPSRLEPETRLTAELIEQPILVGSE